MIGIRCLSRSYLSALFRVDAGLHRCGDKIRQIMVKEALLRLKDMPVANLHHIGFTYRTQKALEEARRFFVADCGAEEIWNKTAPASEMDPIFGEGVGAAYISALRFGNVVFELFNFRGTRQPKGFFNHLAISVSDVQRFVRQLRHIGVLVREQVRMDRPTNYFAEILPGLLVEIKPPRTT